MCFGENGFLDHELDEVSTLFDQQVMLVDIEENVEYVVIGQPLLLFQGVQFLMVAVHLHCLLSIPQHFADLLQSLQLLF
jgi:hypothetical protein